MRPTYSELYQIEWKCCSECGSVTIYKYRGYMVEGNHVCKTEETNEDTKAVCVRRG